MNPAECAHDILVTLLGEYPKTVPPGLIFVAGAAPKDGDGGYLSTVTIHNFTPITENEGEALTMLFRLLLFNSSFRLGDRWSEVTATCFVPLAVEPAISTNGKIGIGYPKFFPINFPKFFPINFPIKVEAEIFGAQYQFCRTSASYSSYRVSRNGDAVNIVRNVAETEIEKGSRVVQAIAHRFNPFNGASFGEDGLNVHMKPVILSDGSLFAGTDNVDDDILTLARLITSTKVDLSP